MRDLFDVQIGLSDHTLGMAASIQSIGFGATFVEKHFIDKKDKDAVDSEFSMEPNEMKILKKELINAKKSIGKVHFGPTVNEVHNLRYKRSLYFNKDLPKGHVIKEKDLICIRPNFGLNPDLKIHLVGKKLKKKVFYGDPTSFDLI